MTDDAISTRAGPPHPDNNLSKTEETRRVVASMVDALNDHDISGMGRFFTETFRWMGNAGCGTKNSLKEFQDNWQRPFQAAFSDKVCIDEARIAEGEWMPPSAGKRRRIPACSWASRPRASGSRSDTWTSGRSWTAGSWITG
jgi:hypothetical protein